MFRKPLLRRHLTVKVPRENGTIGVQRVKVSKEPRKSIVRGFIVNALMFYCAYHTLGWLIYGPTTPNTEVKQKLEQWKKEQEKRDRQAKPSDHWKEQHDTFAKAKAFGQGETKADKKSSEESEDQIVIPIPGWIKELERKPYEPDSPEVKAFTAFKQDEKKITQLYKAFDVAIAGQIRQHRGHLTNLKYINFSNTVSRNLNIGTMLLHPTTYANRCIVVKPDGVTLEWRDIPATSGSRMQKVMHPVIMSKAFLAGVWAFTTTTAKLGQAKVMDFLYPETSTIISISFVKVKEHLILDSLQVAQSASYQDKVIAQLPSATYPTDVAQRRFPFLKGDLEKDSNREVLRSQIQSVTPQHALQHSVDMFKRAWLQGQVKALRSETPGAISIIGFYDYHGTNGRYRVEVFGRYAPGDDTLLGPPQITKCYILSDVVKPKTSTNVIPPKGSPVQASREAKSQVPVTAEAPEGPKSKPQESGEPPKPESVPQAPGKSASPEKESEKKASD